MAKRKRKASNAGPLERDHNGVMVATLADDRGPPERWQHAAYVDDRSERGGATVRRLVDPAPLDHYRRRGLIDGRQWLAGDKLRQTWALAGLQPCVVANLDGMGNGGAGAGVHIVDVTKDALTRCVHALRDVGPELALILVHVLCQEGTASQWAEQRGQRGRYAEQSGMAVLRLALDALVRHYGLDRAAR